MGKTFCLLLLSYLLCLSVRAQENNPIRSADTTTLYALIRTADRLFLQFPDSAARIYYQALSLSKIAGDNKIIVHSSTKLGAYYFNTRRDCKSSYRVLQEALPYLGQLRQEDLFLIPTIYNLLGNAYYGNGMNDSATLYYSMALNSMDSLHIDKSQLRIQVYGNMGAVLASSGQYRQGAGYMQAALSAEGIENGSRGNNYYNLGSLYANYLNNMDSALYCWQQAVAIYKELKNTHKLQELYANMAVGWTGINHMDITKAQRYLDTAIQLQAADAENQVMIQLGLSKVYYYQQQYRPALHHAYRMLEISEQKGDRLHQVGAYNLLTYTYAHLNQAEKELEYRLKAKLLGDSIDNETMMQSINELETRYRLSEKDKALVQKDKVLAEHDAALYRQRFMLTGATGTALLLLLALLGIIRNSRQKRRLHREQIHNLNQQKQIEQLQVKMEAEELERRRIAQELHDGLGVLLSAAKINHNLLAKALPGAEAARSYHESRQILAQMQEEVQTITNNLVPDYITQHGLEGALHTLALKFDRPEAFKVQVQTYGQVRELHPDRSFSLFRIIEEIIHNAVKHSGGHTLMIQLMYHEDQLHITLDDNGAGFDTDNNYSGMGLQNIRNRVKALQGYLNLSSHAGKGTTYILEIPY